MKFNNGYWRLLEGVRIDYPAAAYDAVSSPRTLSVHAPTRRVADLGGTITCPVVTVSFSSPMPDVIGVTVANHLGGRKRQPQFAVRDDAANDVQVEVDETQAVMSAGDLSVHVDMGERWGVEFRAGQRVLTTSGFKCMGSAQTTDGSHYMFDRLRLSVGESVYGLGERFTAFVKNGQVVDCWNDDGGTSSELAYKNVPFYLTDRGYGIFVDSPDRVSFEVGAEVVSRVQFSVPGQVLRYYVIYGPTPKEILRKYTALTGRPALPPAWSFGLWLSTSFTTSYDQDTVLSLVEEMEQHDIPLSVMHVDSNWMREFHWCDFQWDPRRFPDPGEMLWRLREQGVRTCVWINPYIAQQSSLFEEARGQGYLLKRAGSEDVWQWDTWQAGMAVVDFTNPAARAWYAGKLNDLIDMGVDSFKTDFGECIPTDVDYFDGSDPQLMHNYYSYLYNETVFEALQSRRGEGQAVVFARSATAGCQRFPLHWGGDPEPTYVSMAESLRGGLSLALSGFGFWSHDIGGFEGTPPPGLFKRWTAFGLLSSHSRLHGSNSYRVPWVFDAEAVDVLRHFTKLKIRLMPYIFGAACEARDEGVPVLRAMVLEFPEDAACTGLDRQYMLGPDLLVAPVFDDAGQVSYYVPPGEWTNLLSGDKVAGPAWVQERHGFLSLPLMVRPGAVIPVGARDDQVEYDFRDGVTLEAFGLLESVRRVSVPSATGDDAAEFVIDRRGQRVTVAGSGTLPWRLLLVGVSSWDVVVGCSAETTDRGVLVTPDDPAAPIEVTLRPNVA